MLLQTSASNQTWARLHSIHLPALRQDCVKCLPARFECLHIKAPTVPLLGVNSTKAAILCTRSCQYRGLTIILSKYTNHLSHILNSLGLVHTCSKFACALFRAGSSSTSKGGWGREYLCLCWTRGKVSLECSFLCICTDYAI